MIKKQWILTAAAASLLSSFQAQAQITYSSDDLLLNFRNTASPTAGSDLVIDVGQISALASFSGSEVVATSTLIQTVFGAAPSASLPIGFAASASDASGTTGTIWLSRADVVTPGVTPTVDLPQQVAFSQQNPVTAAIGNIGAGAQAGAMAAVGATTVSAGNSDSYQSQGEQSSGVPATINFTSHISTTAAHGGTIETIQTGAGDVYSALWEIPTTGNGSDTYLGYFDVQPNGQVVYTSVSAVPEPSTYVLFGLTGLAGFALCRKIRAVFA